MIEPTRLLEVGELDLAFEPARWAFAERQAASIAAHWTRVRKAKPALFNGRVLLLGRRIVEARSDGVLRLRGAFFETDYADYLAWEEFGFPGDPVDNCFSMAALRGADGAFLIGEMASHTFNAGQIYFPAGRRIPPTFLTEGSISRRAPSGNCSRRPGCRPARLQLRLAGPWCSRLSESPA